MDNLEKMIDNRSCQVCTCEVFVRGSLYDVLTRLIQKARV
jgi:hypothetical protein